MGKVPWSRTLQSTRAEIQLWKAVASWKRGTRVNTRYITRLEKAADITNLLQRTLAEVEQILRESYQRYYALKQDAGSLRETWLQDLAAMKAKEGGGNQQGYYNSLILQERQRLASQQLKRILQKFMEED